MNADSGIRISMSLVLRTSWLIQFLERSIGSFLLRFMGAATVTPLIPQVFPWYISAKYALFFQAGTAHLLQRDILLNQFGQPIHGFQGQPVGMASTI